MKQPPRWLSRKIVWRVIDSFIVVLLTIGFALLYLSAHAWGAWGDDSPGYLYTAGQFIRGEALVVQDPLVQSALEHFGEEKLARFTAPTHHEIISPDGWIASKYPVGLAWLLAMTARITGSEFSMYLVVPWLAVFTVVGTYGLAVVWLNESAPWKRAIGLFAALSVGLASIFANYTVAQPMRDIPALAFVVFSLFILGVAVRWEQKRWLLGFGLFLSGALFGYAINIRETSALLGVVYLGVWWLRRKEWRWFAVVFFTVGLLVTVTLSIWNSVQITSHQQAFRERDRSSIAITSNFDHIQSLQFKNIYNNQGKFRPGVGGALQYWEVINLFSYWQPFILFALIGLILLWRKNRILAWMLTAWIGLMFVLFSMWINPYPRYILIILPPIAITSSYGLVGGLRFLRERLRLSARAWSALAVLVIISFYISLQNSLTERESIIQNQTLMYKSISLEDNKTLSQAADMIINDAQKPPLLIMLGSWKSGISETIMTHRSLRVIRFPRKTNEQPPYADLAKFINELTQTYDVYLWYDSTADATEQRYYAETNHQLVSTYGFTFEPTVEIARLTP